VYGTLTAPLLKECAELYVSDGATLTAPLLKECAELSVSGTLTAPLLKECAELYVSGTLTAPLLKEKRGCISVNDLRERIIKSIHEKYKNKGYLFCDDILSKIISKKKSGKIVLWKTRKIGSRKILYVAQKGDMFSHGETIKQASHDLRYKLTDRDTTRYKGWTLDSIHSQADIIGAYRAITGACETGTKMFCQGKDLPEKMSVKKAIELTKGQYRAEQFAGFFK
jgi:hypothetical protein